MTFAVKVVQHNQQPTNHFSFFKSKILSFGKELIGKRLGPYPDADETKEDHEYLSHCHNMNKINQNARHVLDRANKKINVVINLTMTHKKNCFIILWCSIYFQGP